jgi:hypothetical protein
MAEIYGRPPERRVPCCRRGQYGINSIRNLDSGSFYELGWLKSTNESLPRRKSVASFPIRNELWTIYPSPLNRVLGQLPPKIQYEYS